MIELEEGEMSEQECDACAFETAHDLDVHDCLSCGGTGLTKACDDDLYSATELNAADERMNDMANTNE